MINKNAEKETRTYFGYLFIMKESKKFDKDLEKVVRILNKGIDNLSITDRYELLRIYQSAYHDGGKIEGTTSFDCSATNCHFCQAMREKAKDNPAHICNFCYDYAGEQYKINSLNRHTLNMLIMSRIDFTADELRTIPANMINRINSAGDIPNVTFARNMIRVAMANSNGRFAFWTKNKWALIKATEELGKPENAVYIKSSEIIGRPEPLPKYFDYNFTVYPDKATTEQAIKKGAAECNGKKCRECGYKCYYGTHKAENIAELLRGVNKEKRGFILEWLANN